MTEGGVGVPGLWGGGLVELECLQNMTLCRLHRYLHVVLQNVTLCRLRQRHSVKRNIVSIVSLFSYLHINVALRKVRFHLRLAVDFPHFAVPCAGVQSYQESRF